MKLYIIDSIRTNNFHGEQMMGQIKTMKENAFCKLEHHQNNCTEFIMIMKATTEEIIY
ncbi:hypothetical protein FB379_10128 [Aeribacillus composti]|uniref:hypothetical protein n=1 Tax=Aeribacillus composti TaxID=1868734 RepID=UPI00119BE72E|nr:hypothetical protein [Aeribacillus composti]TVZ89131.1 hypothetical protein FB379_10128 [Aeribacillus composti]